MMFNFTGALTESRRCNRSHLVTKELQLPSSMSRGLRWQPHFPMTRFLLAGKQLEGQMLRFQVQNITLQQPTWPNTGRMMMMMMMISSSFKVRHCTTRSCVRCLTSTDIYIIYTSDEQPAAQQ